MRLRFSLQLIIGAVLIQIAMVSVLVWNTTREIQNSHAQLLVGSAQQQSVLMTSALVPGLAYRDPVVLQEVLGLVAGERDLQYVVVTDAAGHRLAWVGTPPDILHHGDAPVEVVPGRVSINRDIELEGQRLGALHVAYATTYADALTEALGRRNVTLGMVVLFLSVLAAVTFALMVTGRLRRLKEGAQAIRAGNLGYRIPAGTNDEVGDVAHSLNALAAELDQSHSSLERQNLQLNRSVDRLETLLQGAEAIIWEADPQTGEWRFMSGDTHAILGIPASRMYDAQSRERLIHPTDLPHLREAWRTATAHPRPVDYRFRHGSGEWIWLRDIVSAATDSDKRPVLRGLTLDVTVHRKAEAALKQSEARYREVLDHISEVIFRTDGEGRWTMLNPAWTELTGFTVEESLGRPVSEFVLSEDKPCLEAFCAPVIQGHIPFDREEVRIVTRDGGARWVSIYARSSLDEHQQVSATFGTLVDITERKAAEEEIRRLAFYDNLTSLPNRSLLHDRLNQAMATAHRNKGHGAVLFIDLDNFKDINDTLGHEVGDDLLRQVARRMLRTMRQTDTLARLGGDEFVVVLNDLHPDPLRAATQAEALGRKLIGLLQEPFRLDKRERHCTPSIGVTLFGQENTTVDELLRQADLAMYRAKAAGRNTLSFFAPEMHRAAEERAALEADFRKALRDRDFFLHYQPYVDDQGQVRGAEALLRWQHPERGRVSPMEFIPVAEQTGLITELGHWVLESVCRELAAWAKNPDCAQLDLAVNVSAYQFRHPDFVRELTTVLEQTGAPPGKLVLELTESLLLDDTKAVIERMNTVRELGVSFALDDFGTGYSSLSYLKRLPLSKLKIDQSFVRDLLLDPNDAAIAEMIISLSKTLGLEVIAEGVETREQLDFLSVRGCRCFQGYLFGHPVPLADLEDLILTGRTGTDD
ncbi:sensor domain-containing diguanylate cyclase [Thioalkalivibrio denitrificans]|uniref:cyclic-guanylate-specific phosphodiesterase n=1 Tax=Thioalkalivibrio denitrificans TaxID=108003 RepID=A0A1V3NTF0_9GAMM|nr:EAL domain-containing protein [Thioalkalivibrio denitrificans]OOG28138.1 sensor domain-containing diguanylate cyclase [Thioalkalivibrio denitrificans]